MPFVIEMKKKNDKYKSLFVLRGLNTVQCLILLFDTEVMDVVRLLCFDFNSNLNSTSHVDTILFVASEQFHFISVVKKTSEFSPE
jgi:hypothetical protein